MVEVNEFNAIHRKLMEALDKRFGEEDSDQVKLNEIFLHKREFIFEKEDTTFAAKYSLDGKGNLMIWDAVVLEKPREPESILKINSTGKTDVHAVNTPPPEKPEPNREPLPASPEKLPGWENARPIQGHGSQISRPREHK